MVLLCGGGLVGFIALVANNADTDNSIQSVTKISRQATEKFLFRRLPRRSIKILKNIDLSIFDEKFPEYGNLEYKDDELVMSSKRKGTYFVIVPTLNYKTENAVTQNHSQKC